MRNTIATLSMLVLMPLATNGQTAAISAYSGMCDASAAVALDADRFVAANDEDNVLRIFSRSRPGLSESTLDLSRFLEVEDKSPETDLEGAARIGDRIYWITSHGRNAEGKKSPNRRRFFATDVVRSNAVPTLVPAGIAYRHLLRDLTREPRLRRFGLDEAAKLAPKERGALNIEGLSATPEGHLLIGFRNPIPGGQALLVPLLNPDELLRDQPARFGDPVLLDLDGLGVRGIEYHQGQYVIIAGSYDGQGASRVCSWKGAGTPVWIPELNLGGLNPEGLFFPETTRPAPCVIISDDGTKPVGDKECKKLKDAAQKHFRAVTVRLPEP